MRSRFSHVQLFETLWPVVYQTPLYLGFSRQECWSGLLCPSSGDLPDPGIKPASPVAPALQADSLPLSHWGSPIFLSFLFAGFILILQIELLKLHSSGDLSKAE